MRASALLATSLQRFGRWARFYAACSAWLARYRCRHPLRRSSRLIVDGERPNVSAIDRMNGRRQCRGISLRVRPDSGPVGIACAAPDGYRPSQPVCAVLRCDFVQIDGRSCVVTRLFASGPTSRLCQLQSSAFEVSVCSYATSSAFILSVRCCVDRLSPQPVTDLLLYLKWSLGGHAILPPPRIAGGHRVLRC